MRTIKKSLLGMLLLVFIFTTKSFGQDAPKEEFKSVFITVTTGHWSDDPNVDGADWMKTEKEYFEKVTMKNDLIIGSGYYTHYFTPDNSEVLFVSVYANWEDIEKANDVTAKLIEQGWPDEAARFCMLWMTGLMAPTAFRRGGFVAIDFINQFIPSIINVILSMVLLLLSLLVLITSVQIGYAEVTGFGGRFATASLYIPVSIDLQNWYRIPRSWMMMSLLIGCVLLILVNLELIGRNIIFKLGKGNLLPKIHDDTSMEIT